MSTQQALTSPARHWLYAARRHAASHPWTTSGLTFAFVVILILLAASVSTLVDRSDTTIHYGLWGGLAGFLATAIGALPALALKQLAQRLEDTLLGFAAGMMLAASAFSLLLPGLEAGNALFQSATAGAAVVVGGMMLGVLLMLGLDEFTPHEHDKSGPCGPGHASCGRVWLFVFAIALHNLPEGMAIGVSFAQGDISVGLPLTSAIALQDIPEGLAVALALRSAGLAPWQAVIIAALSGLLEPLGALLGLGLSTGLAVSYPIGLGLAAGAMLFVVSHEVIPETHRNGHQTPATLGLMGGFALMMVLDTSLG
ncbi:MAG: ZIP family metal transporter [Hahellaceae bacterium]|nr:ZIP family metal transporter [Hahellaceae bacterium]